MPAGRRLLPACDRMQQQHRRHHHHRRLGEAAGRVINPGHRPRVSARPFQQRGLTDARGGCGALLPLPFVPFAPRSHSRSFYFNISAISQPELRTALGSNFPSVRPPTLASRAPRAGTRLTFKILRFYSTNFIQRRAESEDSGGNQTTGAGV